MRPGKLYKAAGNGFLLGSAPAERSDSSEGTPFRLNSRTSVFYPTGNALLKRNAEFLSEYVAQSMNFALPVREQAEGEAPNMPSRWYSTLP